MEYKSDYQQETEHLENTIQTIDRSIQIIDRKKREKDAELIELKRMYTSDTPEFYNDIPISEELGQLYTKLLREYKLARDKPYFGKIDFTSLQDQRNRILYIGKYGVYDYESPTDILVIDWRAPVAELYYNANLGESCYNSPGGEIQVNVNLKTTFEINDGKIVDIFDSEIIANDDLLIKYLSKNKDVVLNDIVATIQQDQNQIIRLTPFRDVIVQGVAGSGKTTVAIHRISYLLYNFKEELNSHNLFVIASSKLFLNYITSMLPDLDVPEIRQGTMAELFSKCIREYDGKFTLTPSNEKQGKRKQPVFTMGGDAWDASETQEAISRINSYFENLEAQVYDEESTVQVFDFVLMTRGDIQMYLDTYRDKRIMDRARLLDESLSERIRKLKDSIIEYILENKREPYILQTCQEIFKIKSDHLFESDLRAAYPKLVTKYKGYFQKKIKKLKYQTVFADLKSLCSQESLDGTAFSAGIAYVGREQTKGNDNVMTLQDLALLLLVTDRFSKPATALGIRHIVIDEAQDFPPFVYYVLKAVFQLANFTLVGDVMQNISSGGLNRWEDITSFVFPSNVEFRKLSKSYRNTIQISNFAGNLVKRFSTVPLYIEPVIRQGRDVVFPDYTDDAERADKTVSILRELDGKGFQISAVICRTDKAAETLYHQMKDRLPISILDTESGVLETGHYIMSLHNAKGLEFDGVILYDLDSYALEDGEDLKLAYVAVTRALHELHVFTNNAEIKALA